MALPTRARIAGLLAICLLMLGAPGALAGTNYQPDASIREGSGAYVGEGVFNLNGDGQEADGYGIIGEKVTFWIKIKNVGALADSFKVRRSAGFNAGYRVRYYSAGGKDVTGQVNVGSFTTPSLNSGQEYVMRATVKVRPNAAETSNTSRLITVSSVNAPSIKDAVRFTGIGSLLFIAWIGFDADQALAQITGSGLQPGATVYWTLALLAGGIVGPHTFGDVGFGGSVSIPVFYVDCDAYVSMTFSALAPNGSVASTTEPVPC